MGKSLYRSYRSRSFDEIIGQDHITTVLENALKTDSISHAYLLSGPRGVGKTSTARILAHAVNELEYEGENLNLDIIEIDAASNRRIDEIRDIRDKVNILPVASKYKVYIIDEVHMLTKEAFNALLKTLEEPPAHVIFILATTESHKVPETIQSRCVKLNFKPISNDMIFEHLKSISKKEKINISDKALELVSDHARGSFRDAISLLEQVKFISEKIDEKDINLMLGMASAKLINQIIESIEKSDIKSLRFTLENAFESGVNESILSSQISKKLRDLLVDNQTSLDKAQIIETLKNLLEVAGSSNPRIEIELTLTNLIIKTSSKNTVLKIEEKPQPIVISESKVTPIIKKEEFNQPKEIVIPENATPKNQDFWESFLKKLKTKNNTLYGITRMAEVNLSNDVLKLDFKFPFHYKQVNESKNQKIFQEILESLNKKELKIVSEVNKSEKKEQTDEFKNISNIFGSHEVLES